MVHSQLHDLTTEPGLTGLSDSGFIEHDGVQVAWYEVGPKDAAATADDDFDAALAALLDSADTPPTTETGPDGTGSEGTEGDGTGGDETGGDHTEGDHTEGGESR